MQRLGLASLIGVQALPRARPGAGHGGRAHRRARTPSWPPRAGGTPRRWPRTSAWPMPTRTICMRRWTGCSRARTRSRRSSPRATCATAAWCCTTCPRATSRAARCPLAKRGYSRDGKRGTLQVNYGLLTDARGCPVAVSVHEGNTADSKTFMPAVQRLRERLRHRAHGDGGRPRHDLAEGHRRAARARRHRLDHGAQERARSARWSSRGICSWACSTSAICSSSSSPEYPGERLVACRNPRAGQAACAQARGAACGHRDQAWARSRPAWTRAGSRGAGRDRRARGQGHQPVQGGQALRADDRRQHVHLRAQAREPSPPRPRWTASTSSAPRCAPSADGRAECVRNYKSLANVERAFRSLKTIDLKVRPIHHRTGRSGARAHLPVHAGLLRRVAHARGLARADVRRHRSAGQGHARPGRTGQALQGGAGQGAHATRSTTARPRTASRP